jgi:methyl-accepting chemotaxis protein
MRKRQKKKQSRIAIRLVVYLLMVALVPLCVAGAIVLHRTSSILHSEAVEHLCTIAESRTQRVTDFFRERRGDAITLSMQPLLASALRELDADPETRPPQTAMRGELGSEIRPLLVQFCDAYGYADILLVSTSGRILLSATNGPEVGARCADDLLQGSGLPTVVERARTLLDPQVSDYLHYAPINAPAMFTAVAVLGPTGRTLGIAALRLPGERLVELVRDYRGLGETGDLTLATRMGDEAVVITPLRDNVDAPFRVRFAFDDPACLPFRNGLRGQRGYGTYRDHARRHSRSGVISRRPAGPWW